jgi:hypothetical protein
MSKFHEMMAKKRDMKPSEKHAKMGVLKDLKDSLSDAMSDKMSSGPMKKVSVMSNSPQGLSAGLDKAKQMAGQSPDMDQDNQMSEGGIANSHMTDPSESYKGDSPGPEHNDDGFMAPNPNEAYSTGMPMEDHQSMQDSDEPEHVGYFKGGEIGPEEEVNTEYHGNDFGKRESDSEESDEVEYSGDASGDDGFKHPNSDETDDVAYASGGRVKSPLDEAADSAQDERDETVGDAGDDDPPMYKGMNLQEVEEHLQHLLRMKRQMEKQ